ncbi:MAG: GTPase Era [bacterium]|nr:MAG: GTPase Era [bacterium]
MNGSSTFRAGYVALIGRPNVGKSTLLNALLQFKLSIVTAKPQTTRKKIAGILNNEKFQIIFYDTPGLLQPGYNLQRKMMEYLQEAIGDADVIVLITDVQTSPQELQDLTRNILPTNKPVLLILNKIDLVGDNKMNTLLKTYQELFPQSGYLPVSARRKQGLESLINKVVDFLPEHPPYYPQDYLSDSNERFFIAEIIREKIFEFYQKEIPYACHVEIEDMKEKKGRKDFIQAVIYVDQPSQKGIIIGSGGKSLKHIGESSRRDIETFLGRPVYLELYVKVLKNWRKKMSALKNLGF